LRDGCANRNIAHQEHAERVAQRLARLPCAAAASDGGGTQAQSAAAGWDDALPGAERGRSRRDGGRACRERATTAIGEGAHSGSDGTRLALHTPARRLHPLEQHGPQFSSSPWGRTVALRVRTIAGRHEMKLWSDVRRSLSIRLASVERTRPLTRRQIHRYPRVELPSTTEGRVPRVHVQAHMT
jgi:hypothetical protein